jgi:tRNA(Ile)-lysidine synthase
MELTNRVLRFIQEHSLISELTTLLVGVSGGPDSICLLHILCQIKDKLGLELHIAHLNHMLRDAESDADAQHVSLLAQQLDIPITTEKRDVKAYQAKRRCSLEQAAREVRYAFFAQVAEAIGTETVAVGHTADDQVETILMHLIRGSGLGGLRGMQPLTLWHPTSSSQLKVIRPLLEVTRGETEAYCATVGIAPRYDSSNRSLSHLRNRIRYELIPLLQRYNPNIKAALLRTAHAAAAEQAFWQHEVSNIWDNAVEAQPNGIAIKNKAFSSLPPALKRHLLHSALEQLLKGSEEIKSIHIESMIKVMSQPAGKRLSLPDGLIFYGDYERCLITREAFACPFPILHGEQRLNIPGETVLPGWLVKAAILKHRPDEINVHSFQAYLDFDVAGKELTVRGWRAGDRFQPLGMSEPKKLQDFMVDAKIPRSWRERVPIVSSPEHILWVVGYRIDHRVRLTPQTKRILHIKFEWISSLPP